MVLALGRNWACAPSGSAQGDLFVYPNPTTEFDFVHLGTFRSKFEILGDRKQVPEWKVVEFYDARRRLPRRPLKRRKNRTKRVYDFNNNTSVIMVEWNQQFLVYPNSTTGIINIETLEEIERVEVFDLKGQLLFASTALSRSTVLDLSNYKRVIYFLKMFMKNGEVHSRKAIKE